MTMASKIIAVAKVLLGGNYCLFTKEVYSPLPIGLLLPVANAFALTLISLLASSSTFDFSGLRSFPAKNA